MIPTVKSIFLKLFFAEKFRGQLVAAIASVIVSYLATYIPGLPHLAQIAIVTMFELPADTVFTQELIVTLLSTQLMLIINAIGQQLIAKENNEALILLATDGSYRGKIDARVGPKAQESIAQLAENAEAWHTDTPK